MRATLLGFGLLAIGAGVATAVYAQVNQTVPTDGRPPQFGAPAAASYDGMLLADGNDAFSAARKMQGSQFYASGGVPSGGTRYADAPISQVANPAVMGGSTDAGAAPQQVDQNSAAPQSIYPPNGSSPMGWASGSQSAPSSRLRQIPADASSSSSSNTGMKTLQQRLAAMRNSSAAAPTPADSRLSSVDGGTPLAAIPAPALAPTAAGQSRMISQQDKQSELAPASIQVGPSPTSIMQTSGSDTDAASRPVVSVASVPSGPVVGGPI